MTISPELLPIHECEIDLFHGFVHGDRPFIEEVVSATRQLLRRPDLSPRDIVQIGHCLLGLQRLPAITPGLSCYLCLSRHFSEVGHDIDSDLHRDALWRLLDAGLVTDLTIQLVISLEEDYFSMSAQGMVSTIMASSDSFSGPYFTVEAEGYRDSDLGFGQAAWLHEYRKWCQDPSVAVTCEGSGDIDSQIWEDSSGTDYWPCLQDEPMSETDEEDHYFADENHN